MSKNLVPFKCASGYLCGWILLKMRNVFGKSGTGKQDILNTFFPENHLLDNMEKYFCTEPSDAYFMLCGKDAFLLVYVLT
jgi:hypothetical protein